MAHLRRSSSSAPCTPTPTACAGRLGPTPSRPAAVGDRTGQRVTELSAEPADIASPARPCDSSFGRGGSTTEPSRPSSFPRYNRRTMISRLSGRGVLAVLVATAALATPTPAQSQTQDERDVIAVVQKLFDAMASCDGAARARISMPEGRLYRLATAPTTAVRSSTFDGVQRQPRRNAGARCSSGCGRRRCACTRGSPRCGRRTTSG